MSKSTWYLIGIGCFIVAVIAGIVSVITGEGTWTNIAIPFALGAMVVAFWSRIRKG
ncbi:MAG: hypothetical protein WC005_00875 [Candidatus Nanopelagicales bacterium]